MGICSYNVLINMDFYMSEVKVSTDKQILHSITGQILYTSSLTNTAYTLWILSWSIV